MLDKDLKGEEKASASTRDFSGAIRELQNKFYIIDPISFGNIQFMICYAAAGLYIASYAIDGSPELGNQINRLIQLTDLLKISHRMDRITIIKTMINITHITLTVIPIIPKDTIPLGKEIKFEETTIAFYDDRIEKTILKRHLPYLPYVNINDHMNVPKAVKVSFKLNYGTLTCYGEYNNFLIYTNLEFC